MGNRLLEVAAGTLRPVREARRPDKGYSADLVIPNTPDLTLAPETPKIRCPFCLKPQVKDYQNLICGTCNREELELVRNSVVENDQMNHDTRLEINEIFAIYKSISEGNNVTEYSSRNKTSNIPYATLRSIKILSLQLLKLEILNHKLKVRNIEKSQRVLSEKIDQLTQNIAEKQTNLTNDQNKITTKSRLFIDKYNSANDQLVMRIMEYKLEKNFQVEKQIYQSQLNHIRILNEIVFSKKKKPSKNSLIGRRYDEELLFFNQPILDIANFLNYNHKLVVINEFLENLIKLQVQLFDIIQITNSFFKFPYLDELVKYLPDKRFYDLVQEKENFMVNGGKMDETTTQDPTEDDKETSYKVNEINKDHERIVKLGDAIKLPLSSKTINNQLRRASLNAQTPVETPPIPAPEEKVEAAAFKSSLKGKKVIIIPHKILTKPFTKLTTDEYLKFLLIIVKIIVNFKTLFAFTINKLSRRLDKKSSSSTISDTINHIRGNYPKASPDASYDLYDFRKILTKVFQLQQYFESQLDTLKLSNKHVDTASMANSQVSSRSISSKSSSVSLRDARSPLLTLYSTFFKEPSKAAKPADLSPLEKEIYGNISETHETGANLDPSPESDPEMELELEVEARSLPSSLYPHYKPKAAGMAPGSAKSNEVKTIMQNVYWLITHGASRANKGAKPSGSGLDAGALDVMVRSKGQLDDWDLVSKMY